MSKSRLPTQERLLLLDIDYVLFDGDAYSEDVDKALILNMGVSKEDFKLADKEYLSSLIDPREYDPVKYSQFMANKFKVAYSPLERITTDIERAKRGTYYDTYESVDLLSRVFDLGIYSEGVEEFQRMKLKALNLSLFLNKEHIHILPNKEEPSLLRSLPEGTIIADDKLRIIQFISQFENIIPVMVDRRNKYPEYDGLYATSLEDLYMLLNKKRYIDY